MTNLSEQQLEQLSAYLDGELLDHERIAVEQQLQDNPALASELREMQTMLAMLRDVPAIQPPRTFTLDPAQYGRRRWAGFGWMRWASVLGALVLMLTVGLTLTQQGGSDTAQTAAEPAAPAGDTAMRLAPAAATVADAASSVAGSAAAPMRADMEATQDQPMPTFHITMGGEPMGGELVLPESSANTARKTSEVTPSHDMLYALSPVAQPVPGAAGNVETTPINAPTDSLDLSQTNTLPFGGGVAVPPLQESGTSSPDTRDLQPQEPLPDPLTPKANSAAGVADESPALWLIFLVAALIGIGATIVVTRALRHVK